MERGRSAFFCSFFDPGVKGQDPDLAEDNDNYSISLMVCDLNELYLDFFSSDD